jgi:hypothetical protein
MIVDSLMDGADEVRSGTVTLKLNFPLLSALVLPPTSMPLARLMRMTSSPAAGLLVVPLVTVPVRVWAAAVARASERMAARMRILRIESKELLAAADRFAISGSAKKSVLHRISGRQSRTTNTHRPV